MELLQMGYVSMSIKRGLTSEGSESVYGECSIQLML